MAVFSILFRVLASVAVAQAGIHPEGHWDRCTALTPETADDFVKENVDAGKTVIVRWIASEG
jgi:hypothetical protein